ncbi:MAG: hypothetical protein HY079_05735, partial [Elusimicrobia bacterium]|nr:hypothetical protein [Elusimicrobiota bacterium]
LSAPWTSIAATGVSVPDAQHLSGTVSLSGAATGYWDVVVRESGGRVGRLAGGFRVAPPALAALVSVPSSAAMTVGDTRTFGAVGTFTDGSTAAVSAAWTSDSAAVGVTASGLAAAAAAGTAHLTASSGTVAAVSTVTVSARPTVASITVAPSTATLLTGATQALVATGHMSDGSTRVLAPAVFARGPAMIRARQGASGAFVNGRFYAIGGNGTQSMEVYDPTTGAWTALAAPPVNRSVSATAVIGNTIYVIGGCVNSDCTVSPTGAVYAYDVSSNAWSSRAAMPAARHGMVVDVIGGKIYSAGGYTGNFVASADVLRYDPATDAWTTLASLPAVRAYAAGGAMGGKLYVAGGTSHSFAQTLAPHVENLSYDPAADTWTAHATMPDARALVGSAVLDGKLYVVDGQCSTGSIHGTFVYDPSADSWAAGPTTNDSRYTPAIAGGDGTLFVAATLNANVISSSFEFVTPAGGVSWSSDAPAVASVTAVGLATGLSAGNAHAVAASGAVTGSAALTVSGAPALTGSAPGTTSVQWNWAAVAGQSGFRVLTSTGGDRSGALSASATGWLETGLAVSTAVTRRLLVFDAHSSTAVSALTTVYTRAAPPTGSAGTPFVSSATLSWSLNGNSAGTLAAVERSTDAAAFAAVYSSAVVAFSDGGLAACTTYYYRVRNFNGDGLATVYDATVTLRTGTAAPLPPGSLTAQSLAGALVAVTWGASPSSYLSEYRLYMSTGVLTYGTPYAVLPASVTAFTTPALSTGVVYRFGLRAYSACAGADDGNTNLIASASPLVDASQVVRFQYRTAASTSAAWTDIPAADVQHPNPAAVAPYFVHWNVTALPNGSYELRAVATAVDASVDPAPPTIVIGVDAVDHDVDETVVGGSQKKDEKVYSGASRTVGTADDASGAVVAVTLPAGCVTASTDTLTVQVNPTGAPAPGKSQIAVGQNLQITLGSGQTALNTPATITMHYADADGDGVVDGTPYRVDALAIYSYDAASGEWRKESASTIDRAAKTVTATTPHFSLFGLFTTAAADLSSVLVYPVPWVPNDADPDNGKPFAAGDTTSGIVFDGVTDSVRVQVFSASGSLVWDYSTAASGGRVQWDGRNTNGRDAASGGYVVVITDRDRRTRIVRKIAIIR